MHCIKREQFKCKELIVFSCKKWTKKLDLLICQTETCTGESCICRVFWKELFNLCWDQKEEEECWRSRVSFTHEWQIPELLQLLNHNSCDPGPLNQSLCETEIVSSESWRSTFFIDARFVGIGDYLAEILLFENLRVHFWQKKKNSIILTHKMYCWLLLQIHSRANLLGTPCYCLQNGLNSLWHRFNKVLETFLRDVGHIVMIASRSCCRFVGCTSMMWISRSITSQRCSIGLRSGDCGGCLSKVNSLSCSRNQSEMIWALWHGALSC